MQDDVALGDELIASIYDGVFGEHSWQRFLDTLAAAIPACRASLVVNDDENGRALAVQTSRTWEASLVDRYNGHYAAQNPLPRLLARRESDQAYADAQLIPLSEFHRTEFFNDFLLRNDMGFSAGVRLAKENDRAVFLGISAPPDLVCPASVVAQLNRLGPHLRRAFAHYRKVAPDLQALNNTTDLFDMADIGMMVLGEGARAQLITPTMSAMLANDSPIEMSSLGGVRLRSEEAQAVLTAMLRRRHAGFHLPRSVDFPWRNLRLTLVRLDKDGVLIELEGPTVVVLLQPANERIASFDSQRLAMTYGLTKAEHRALSGIMAGKSVDQIAQDAFVSRETIRSQIKSLYAKTGATSKAEVIRLALLPVWGLGAQ